MVELIDLRCFGRAARLVWRKHRWCCPERACLTGSWTHVDERIASPRVTMTARAARWATRQVGRLGRSVNEVAEDLGCDWHTVNDTVLAYGEALLEADTERFGTVDAFGLDETLFNRTGQWRRQQWCTSVVNVGGPGQTAQLIDLVAGRSAAGADPDRIAMLDRLIERPRHHQRELFCPERVAVLPDSLSHHDVRTRIPQRLRPAGRILAKNVFPAPSTSKQPGQAHPARRPLGKRGSAPGAFGALPCEACRGIGGRGGYGPGRR